MAGLCTIARNTVIDHYRTRRQAAMQRLTEDQREVLILKFIAQLDTAQIARRLGKSQGAIRALQMRALQALAIVIEVKDQQ